MKQRTATACQMERPVARCVRNGPERLLPSCEYGMMNIIVCVKQVPDTVEVEIDRETNTLIREGVDGVINPFDLYAVEEALCLRDQYGGTVTALSMGLPQVVAALRETISLGVDNAVLLSDGAFAGADTLATSYALARGIRTIGRFDLVICGRQAIDGDTAHVGPELAEWLGVAHVGCVRQIREVADGCMITERVTEDGLERIKLPLPGLITVAKGINEPRFPTLKGMMRAMRSEIPIWSAQDVAANVSRVGLKGSPTRVVRTFTPDHHRRGEILEGTTEEQVTGLLCRLRKAGLLQEGTPSGPARHP